MFCTKCGTALPSGSIRCRLCRTPVTGAPAALSRPAMGGGGAPAAFARPGLISLLAVLHFIGAGLMAFVVVVVVATAHDERPLPKPYAALFIVLAVVHFFAGRGLWRLESYGRTIEIVLCVFGLFAIPIGTIISILLLLYFNKPEIKALFSGELTPQDYARLRQGSGGGGASIVIVLLCVFAGIAVLGILAAIAVPNFLTAMQRAKQKRTIADMTDFARSINAYAEANHRLPLGNTVGEVGNAIHWTVRADGWGHEFRYLTDGQQYWLISAGKDGQFEHEKGEEYSQAETKKFDADIVLHNSEWVQVPEGLAK